MRKENWRKIERELKTNTEQKKEKNKKSKEIKPGPRVETMNRKVNCS